MLKKMAFVLVPLGLYFAALVVLSMVSGVTGPTFDEVDRLAVVTRCEALIVNLVDHGPSVLVSSSAMAIYDDAKEFGIWPTIASGWLSAASRQSGAGELLTAHRAGYLLVTATLPLSVLWITRRRLGSGLAAACALLLFAEPWLLHEAAVASDDALVAACWLLVFSAYIQSLPDGERGPRLGWMIATAVLLGGALAIKLQTLWVVLVILVHFVVLRRSEFRDAVRHGRVPMPAAVLFALVIVPPVFALSCPAVWRGGPSKVARLILGPLGAGSDPTLYRGEVASLPPFPPTEAVHLLLAKTPLLLLGLAVVGIGLWVREVVERRRGSDPTGLGLATAIFLLATVFGTVVTPPLLASFPTRIVAAMAFIAVLAAVALRAGVARLFAARLRPIVIALAIVGMGAPLLVDIQSAGGAYGWVVGGPAGVLEHETFSPSDGSELGQLPELLPEGGARIFTRAVPGSYFEALNHVSRGSGKIRTAKSRGQADFELVRGDASDAAAQIEYHRAVLWSLVRAGS